MRINHHIGFALILATIPGLAPALAVAEILRVDRFGAIANDGKPDDHAISAAMRRAQKGDIIQFAVGTYHVRDAIHVNNGVTLAGDVMDKTIVRALPKTMLSQRQSIVNMDDTGGVTVRDLTLDGGNLPDLPFGVLGGYGGGGNRLLNVRIVNIAGQDADGAGPVGVLFTDQPGNVIRGGYFDHLRGRDGEGAAIGLYGGPYVIDGNHIANVGRNGIYALRCSGSIVNNVVENSGTGAKPGNTGLSIELHPGDGEGGCKDVVVSGNKVDSWISVVSAMRAAIRNNVIGHSRQDERYAGIETSGQNIIVSGNRIGRGVHSGIAIERPSFNIAVFDNDVDATDTVGMAFIGARTDDPKGWLVENVLVANNRFANINAQPPNAETSTAAGTGLEINRGAVRITVMGNRFENNDASAIALFDEKGDTGPDQLFFANNRFGGNKKGILRAYGYSGMKHRRLAWKDNEGAPGNPLPGARSTPWRPFQPLIESNRSRISVGQVVRFSLKALPSGATDVLWDFGEGRPVPGKTARRKFAKPGSYRVRAVVWLKSGQAAMVQKMVDVVKSAD